MPSVTEEALATGLFSIPEEGEESPAAIAARLVAEMPEFEHLRIGEPVIVFLFRHEAKERGGKKVLGELALPRFQGGLAPVATWLLAKVCGGLPDFLMILDAEWWQTASPREREILVFHELCHAEHARDREGELRFTEEGRPVWALRAHDLEEFDAVVRRYGAWQGDIHSFVGALREGGAV